MKYDERKDLSSTATTAAIGVDKPVRSLRRIVPMTSKAEYRKAMNGYYTSFEFHILPKKTMMCFRSILRPFPIHYTIHMALMIMYSDLRKRIRDSKFFREEAKETILFSQYDVRRILFMDE